MHKVIPIRVRDKEIINYTYLVVQKETNTALLIDPSWESEIIDKTIKEQQVWISDILITHTHNDHIASLLFFVQKYNARVWVSESEVDFYQFQNKNLYAFKHEEKMIWGEEVVTMLITPGHTKGSACFLIGNNIFTGDTLFAEGCGTCIAKGGDALDMYNSIAYLKKRLQNDNLIYPGHSFGVFPGMSFGKVKKINMYLGFNDAVSFRNFRNRKNQSAIVTFQ